MFRLTKVALLICLAWINASAHGQGISRRLWRCADEILLVKIIKEERGSFSTLCMGTCITHVTAEIVTAYKVKRIDTVQRDLAIARIFSCRDPLNSDDGLLNPKKQYVVFLSSKHALEGRRIYPLTDDFLGIVEYTDELRGILKRKRR